jgi:hypothetical protein
MRAILHALPEPISEKARIFSALKKEAASAN